MAQGLLAKLRELIQGNASVRKVANDPALMAELLLLFEEPVEDVAHSLSFDRPGDRAGRSGTVADPAGECRCSSHGRHE